MTTDQKTAIDVYVQQLERAAAKVTEALRMMEAGRQFIASDSGSTVLDFIAVQNFETAMYDALRQQSVINNLRASIWHAITETTEGADNGNTSD